MPGPIFQKHHTIEQQTLRNSELLDYLQRNGAYDIDAAGNLINMPNEPALAQRLDISPHSGGPIRDYQDGTAWRLDRLQRTADGQAALEGDPEARIRIASKVEMIRDTMRVGLINGDLHTNAPFGMVANDVRPQIQGFFNGMPGYQQAHGPQIDALRSLQGPEVGWASIVHNEGRIITTLQHMERTGDNLVRGGDALGARNELSQAITRAYTDSRLNLSSQGIERIERTLGAEAAEPLRVPRSMRGFATPELLVGELSSSTLIRSGGLLATGADLALTAQRAAELSEQGNTRAAQSEVNHALARNAGGWIGGASAAYVVGMSGYLPATVVAGDALLMSKAFDKAVDLADNHGIYNQTDRQQVAWKFTGRNWERKGALDATQDSVNNPVEVTIGATYEKSRELGTYATAASVELALGKAPAPLDPFNIPAQASDQVGLDNQNWRRNADTQQWMRQVKMGVEGANDRGVYREEVASPERAAALNREAIGRIEQNIAQGPEAIASAYLANYTAQRSQDFMAVPAAVQSALPKAGVVRGSDEQAYQRGLNGVWSSQGQVAQGNMALELELTNLARQPSLERNARTLAELEARPAPSPEQTQQNELLHRYRIAGTELNPQWQQAVELALARTRAEHGLTGPGAVQLLRNADGQIAADSPIAHYQRGADGVDRIAATTSSQDIRQALDEVQGRSQDAIPTLGTVSAVAPSMGRKREQEPDVVEPAAKPVLANNPSHPDFDTFNRIHQWVSGTGQWDEEKSLNVASALYKEQTGDPLLKRVDKVCGAVGRDGAENVFAVYAPFGDKDPFFLARVDGREACQQPALQNLEQAETIKQQQVLQQQQEQQQQNQQVAKGPAMSM